jgi:ankyrin repeat protein/tRNA A-37 threonylcarbamoyl transferase component Bud32
MNTPPANSPTAACPSCGAPLPDAAPQHLCPRCLMAEAMNVDFPDIGNLADVARRLPQFEVIELIGRGGMGVVYKARQPQLDRTVAIKILPPSDASLPNFLERFRREAQALAKLTHPNIVSVYDFGESGGLFYLVMELVDGVNLRQMEETQRLRPEQALAIVPMICDALQYAHDKGVVHRDIKPENILLDTQGQVKIADFGIARIIGKITPHPALTQTSQMIGTPRYMAPEQREGSHPVDHRADIFSLGVVFYEMLTGAPPLGRFEPPSKKVHVDVRLDEVVLKALEQEPARRYQRASELKTDVETISGSPRGQSPTASVPEPRTRSKRGRMAILAGAVVIAIALLAFALDHFPRTSTTVAIQPTQAALFDAAASGQVSRVHDLIRQGADVNDKNGEGTTPLMLAARHGHASMAVSLVLLGANVNESDAEGRTALMVAAEYDQASVIKALYDLRNSLGIIHRETKVPDPNDLLSVEAARSSLSGNAAPQPRKTTREVMAENLPMVDARLLDAISPRVPDIEIHTKAQDRNGETALMKAAARGHIRSAMAMQSWEDGAIQDKAGHTTAMHAALHGRRDFVRWLLDTPMSSHGTSIGTFSCHPAVSAETLAVIDQTGKTAIQLAREKGHPEIAEWLGSEMERTIDYYTRAIAAGGSKIGLFQYLTCRAWAYRALGQADHAARDFAAAADAERDTTSK